MSLPFKKMFHLLVIVNHAWGAATTIETTRIWIYHGLFHQFFQTGNKNDFYLNCNRVYWNSFLTPTEKDFLLNISNFYVDMANSHDLLMTFHEMIEFITTRNAKLCLCLQVFAIYLHNVRLGNRIMEKAQGGEFDDETRVGIIKVLWKFFVGEVLSDNDVIKKHAKSSEECLAFLRKYMRTIAGISNEGDCLSDEAQFHDEHLLTHPEANELLSSVPNFIMPNSQFHAVLISLAIQPFEHFKHELSILATFFISNINNPNTLTRVNNKSFRLAKNETQFDHLCQFFFGKSLQEIKLSMGIVGPNESIDIRDPMNHHGWTDSYLSTEEPDEPE